MTRSDWRGIHSVEEMKVIFNFLLNEGWRELGPNNELVFRPVSRTKPIEDAEVIQFSRTGRSKSV